MTDLNFQIHGNHRTCNVWLYPENNLNLKNLDLEPFDIIICDGPYGIPEIECEWDDFDLNTKEGRKRFRQYYRNLFGVCLKHLKKTGSLFIFNYPEGASIIKSVLDEGYPVYFRRWITWAYENHFDFDRGTNFRRSHEAILYYTKEADGFIFNGVNAGAKPLNVIRYLLNATHRPGGRLLSLFAGSGTDLLAAAEHDMDAVGFEFNDKHIDIITRRLKEYAGDELRVVQ